MSSISSAYGKIPHTETAQELATFFSEEAPLVICEPKDVSELASRPEQVTRLYANFVNSLWGTTDQLLELIRKCTKTVRTLALSNLEIKETFMSYLKEMPEIHHLSIDRCSVNDRLRIREDRFDSRGYRLFTIDTFFKNLAANISTLEALCIDGDLTLDHTSSKPEGVATLSASYLVGVIKANPKLGKLKLKNFVVTEDDGKAITAALNGRAIEIIFEGGSIQEAQKASFVEPQFKVVYSELKYDPLTRSPLLIDQ